MKYFRCSLIAVALLLFAGGAVYWVRQHKTVPMPLTYWLKDLENTSDYKKRQQAETALRQTGTNALPELIYILESNDPWLKTKSYAVVNRVFSKKYSYVTYTQRCAGVSRAFGLLGDQARPAIPDLIRLLQSDDPAIANAAIQCLFHVRLNADDIPLLLPCLTHHNARTRAYAATFLGRITQNEKDVVPALIKAMRDPDDQVKQYTANALGRLGHRAKAAASALSDLCHYHQLEVRIAAAKALVEIGHTPDIVLSTLLEALKSPLWVGRQIDIIGVIEKLGPRAQSSAEFLEQFNGDPDTTLAKAAQSALQRIRTPVNNTNNPTPGGTNM
jgi:HEAT repeat protein